MGFLELFAGAGGLGLGFEQSGYNPQLAIEKDKYACKTYEKNIGSDCLQKDLTETKPSDISVDPDIIIGGPPCQDFSVANYYSRGGEKTNLVFVFYDWVEHYMPEFFVMENVSGIKSVDDIFDTLIEDFKRIGYNINYQVCNSFDFGVPQRRKRMFVVGSLNKRYSFPNKNKKGGTVREAFAGLQSLEAGEKDGTFYNHKAPDHQKSTIERFSELAYEEPVYENWSEKIRLHPDKPSPTVKAGQRSTYHFVHPFDDRGLTVRERARLQTFPDSYVFYGPITEQRTQTGNAVPPKMAKYIAENIKEASDKVGVFDY